MRPVQTTECGECTTPGVAKTPQALARSTCSGACVLALAALSTVFWDQPQARAQDASAAPASGASPAIAPDVNPPTPEKAMAAFAMVRTWINAFAVPEQVALPAGVSGPASVVLRWQGEIVGRGDDAGAQGPALAEAARKALHEARGRLPIPPDATQGAALAALARELTLSVQLGGALVPVSPRTFAQMGEFARAGLDGVAARQGDRVAVVFPEQMLVTGGNPASALASAVSTVTGDPTLAIPGTLTGEAEPVAQRAGMTFARFRVTHLMELGVGETPRFVERGGRLVETREITAASVREHGRRLAMALAARVRAASDATPEELSLSAFVLARYAAAQRELGHDAPGAAMEISRAVVRELVESRDARGPTPDVDAATVLALLELRRIDPSSPEPPAALLESVRGAFVEGAGWSPGVRPASRGLVALALARAAPEAGEGRTHAQQAVRAAFRESAPGDLVALMPFLAWADLALTPAGSELPSAVALNELRLQVMGHQVREDDLAPEDACFLGGVVFSRGQRREPTWLSLRPAAFLASMLREPAVTSGPEFFPTLSASLAAARFARQLAVDETSAWYAGREHMDLLRAGPVLRDTPDAASVAGLLFLTELEVSLARAGGAMNRTPAPSGR